MGAIAQVNLWTGSYQPKAALASQKQFFLVVLFKCALVFVVQVHIYGVASWFLKDPRWAPTYVIGIFNVLALDAVLE